MAKEAEVKWAKVGKNPRGWALAYSVLVIGKGSTLIYSQHRTKQLAQSALNKMVRKHKTLVGARRAMGWETPITEKKRKLPGRKPIRITPKRPRIS